VETRKHGRPSLLLAGLGMAAAFSLSACATSTSTPYQPISRAAPVQGGYSDEHIAGDRWRVTFSGNRLTSRETVEGYLLYRAAELTLEQHRDWFEIVDRETEHEVQRDTIREPSYSPWWGYPSWRPYWRYYDPRLGWNTWYPYNGDPFWSRRIDTRKVERYQATAEIVMHTGSKPPGNGRIFDAREVVMRLEPKILRPAD